MESTDVPSDELADPRPPFEPVAREARDGSSRDERGVALSAADRARDARVAGLRRPAPRPVAQRHVDLAEAIVIAVEALGRAVWHASLVGVRHRRTLTASSALIALAIGAAAWSRAESRSEHASVASAPMATPAPTGADRSAEPPTDPTPDGAVRAAVDAGALTRAAQQAYRDRDFDRAEALARQVLEHAPGSSDAQHVLALSLVRQRRDDEALVEAQRGIALSKRPGRSYSLVGDIHARHGRYARAVRAWQRCLDAHPGYEPCRERLNRRARRRGVTRVGRSARDR